MSFLLVANFKSNKTSSEVGDWIKAVSSPAKSAKNLQIALAPSFVHLPLAAGSWPLLVCAQDVSPFPPGSYTGAVSAPQLKDLGVTYAIVGHSERRRYFHETSEVVAHKVSELLDVGITPIVCLAESDIISQYGALKPEQIKHALLCFEPPSQIGGTETAALPEIQRVVSSIKETFGTDQVMYGGSVNKDNIASLAAINLAGCLVAGGSLDSQDFISLLKNYPHVA